MSASDIRQELNDYYTYLVLTGALKEQPGGPHEQFHSLLTKVRTFIDTATSSQLKDQGKLLLQAVKQAVEGGAKFLPYKISPRQIAQDFRDLSDQTDVWRLGVPYEWLQDRFASQGIMADPSLPPHAKIGIGVHAGNASVEEVFLLEDIYFLLVRAETAFKRMNAKADLLHKSMQEWKDGSGYETLAILNGEVGTFSRLSVVSAAAFVEAFVNSVGWAESTRGIHRGEDDRAQLKGTQKGHYLSLEAKLEKFPKLIRGDGATPIILSDPKQAKEPFVSFLAETKELRDASMHYAPGKAMIWRPPQEWLVSAQRSSEYAVRVAEAFWTACYPGKKLPSYLNGLDHAALLKTARERIKHADSGYPFAYETTVS
ncbi:MAG: hypothetical protein JWP38_2920 [Herbaspirillum sp.]|nr:hypothetical protein [Herbaspirillum sp.]